MRPSYDGSRGGAWREMDGLGDDLFRREDEEVIFEDQGRDRIVQGFVGDSAEFPTLDPPLDRDPF
jgi:hypothetical protein